MTITAPTRITIEVHPGADHGAGGATPPIVRVLPDSAMASQQMAAHQVVAGEPRETVPTPAAFDPGECRCLDDEDCRADHAND